MVQCVLRFLLVGLVLANPAICQLVGCGAAIGSHSGELCRSACCGTAATIDTCHSNGDGACPCSRRDPPAERPDDSPVDSYCQCFSAGAILEESASARISPDEPALDDVDMRLVDQAGQGHANGTRIEVSAQPPPGKANPGRSVRCLHASWLC